MPIHLTTAERRIAGVPLTALLLALGSAALAVSVLLLVLARWVVGSLLLAVGVVLLSGFLLAARRERETALARLALGIAGAVRARAGVTLETAAARSSARRELLRLRAGLAELVRCAAGGCVSWARRCTVATTARRTSSARS